METSFFEDSFESLSELELVRVQMNKQIVKNQHLYLKYGLFLQSFVSFVSVKDINKDAFYELFLELLRKGRENVQQLALECVLKFEKPELHRYQNSLRQLTKKENLRREMLNLNLNSAAGFVEDAHRKELVPVIINLLYPHIFSKKGAHNKSKKSSEMQRNMIFEFFASLKQNELDYLIKLVFKNSHIPIFDEKRVVLEKQKDLLQVHLNTIGQFNIALKNLMQKLGLLLAPFFNRIFNYILTLFSVC